MGIILQLYSINLLSWGGGGGVGGISLFFLPIFSLKKQYSFMDKTRPKVLMWYCASYIWWDNLGGSCGGTEGDFGDYWILCLSCGRAAI